MPKSQAKIRPNSRIYYFKEDISTISKWGIWEKTLKMVSLRAFKALISKHTKKFI